jgi:hypothetical protein
METIRSFGAVTYRHENNRWFQNPFQKYTQKLHCIITHRSLCTNGTIRAVSAENVLFNDCKPSEPRGTLEYSETVLQYCIKYEFVLTAHRLIFFSSPKKAIIKRVDKKKSSHRQHCRNRGK